MPPEMTRNTEMAPRQVIDRHLEAFNRRDRDADPWAADAEMVTPGGTFSGRAAVLGFLSVLQEAFPDGRLSVWRVIADGGDVAVEGTFGGTHDGSLQTPDGVVPATGRRVEFRWAAAYAVRDEELLSEHLYFDQVEFLAALGLA